MENYHPNQSAALQALINCFSAGGKLLLCGNGGSCADCSHIAGELLKGFLKKRPVDAQLIGQVPAAAMLQCGLPAIDLTAHAAALTAIANDLGDDAVYAQQVLAYGRPGDVLIGISTSGNAANVYFAMQVAKARGLVTVGLTGKNGGRLREVSDILLNVNADETYRIQELHLPLYHALCAGVEAAFFAE